MFCKRVFFKTIQKGYGTSMKRFFAFFIDVLMIWLALMGWLLYNLIMSDTFRKEAGAYLSGIITQGELYYIDDFYQLAIRVGLVYFLYSLIMQLLPTRATLTQRWLDLKVHTGETNGVVAILIRNLFKIPTIILWPFTYVLSRTNDKGQWLHDKLSKTTMLDVENK